MHRAAFTTLLAEQLAPERFTDSAENGLQVEGRDVVNKVVCGVSANRALIDAAIDAAADALVVHHGLVWGGGIRRLDGWLGERVRRLMRADVNLFAYHLPLDAQPQFGNNAGLADALAVVDGRVPFGRYKGQLIGCMGALASPCTLDVFVAQVRAQVGAPLAVFGQGPFVDGQRLVQRVGICSGGAPDLLHDAIAQNLDVYVTGEATEWVKAVADEAGIAFVAAGHHATERFGPRGLAVMLQRHGFDACFIDVDNPA